MRTLAAIVLISFATNAWAQAPAFEAATVKKRTEPGGGFMGRQPGGRFTAQGVSLQDLIVFAYGVQPYQIVDGPQWLDTERWDVTAVGAPGAPADVLLALQQLLADRFSSPAPTPAPAPQLPSLRGRWAGTHSMQLASVDPALGSRAASGCDQSWFVTSQTGGNFSGTYGASGHNLESDKNCGYSGTLTGTLMSGGTSVTVRLDPIVRTRGCARVSGGDTFIGTFERGGTPPVLRAEVTDLVTCDEIVGELRAGTYHRTTTLRVHLMEPAAARPD